ncbi:MAG: hypothetical protein RLZZ299_304 [Pseudomonadota bacterium]
MPRFYAVAAPGLEPLVARELAGFGVAPQVLPGGVRFQAELPAAREILRAARTPARLLLEVVEGRVHTPEELVGLVRRADWKPLLHPQSRLEVTASCTRSRLRFKDVVAKKAGWAVGEALKGPRVPDRERRPSLVQQLRVRVLDDVATLSLDLGGDLLHLRGWRQEQGPAPMRENLAASMLLALAWTGEEPLLDPFCGSGTLPVEAALLALGRSPFASRAFACDEWPVFMGRGARPPQRPRGAPQGRPGEAGRTPAPGRPAAPPVRIVGYDRDARVLAAAEANARRAGVELTFRRVDIADAEPPAPVGLVLTNPPWGGRLAPEARTAAQTWEAFGRTLRARFAGWRVGFVCPDPQLARRAHPKARCLLRYANSGIDAGLWSVDALED